MEICKANPAVENAFVERVALFRGSDLKYSVVSIVKEVLTKELRMTYCPIKKTSDKLSFKDWGNFQ